MEAPKVLYVTVGEFTHELSTRRHDYDIKYVRSDLIELTVEDIRIISQCILNTNKSVRGRMKPDEALHYATTQEYYEEVLHRFMESRENQK